MGRPELHIVLHFLVPALAAALFFRKNFIRAYLIMTAALIIDLDHFLAEPLYDPGRCSIGFHPLHTVWAMAGYIALFFLPHLRIAGAGLIIHIILDMIDCILMG
jgi:hypothetical protein